MSDNSNLIVDVLTKTDRGLAMAVDAGGSFKDFLVLRGARTMRFREYERGDHEANMTAQIKKILRLDDPDTAQLEELANNYCRIIVDKMAGRIKVSGIKTDNDAGTAWVAELLNKNNFDEIQGTTYRASIREADAYIMVDLKTTKWSSEPAYDGFSGMVVIFGTTGPTWACKLWSEGDFDLSENEAAESSAIMKIVVYQPGKISYWNGGVGGTEVTKSEGEEGEHEMAGPIGKLPIVHFANQRDNYTNYGESELRPAYPLQNLMNRTLHSMLSASEFSGFKIHYAIGLALDKEDIVPGAVINMTLEDKEGKPITEPTEEQIELLKAVQVGELGETDMSQYVEQLKMLVEEVSQVTQTPIYGITASGPLSGEALKQLEIGLVGKVERYQRENTDAWKELIFLTAEIQNAFKDTGSAPAFDSVFLSWKSPELRNIVQLITSYTELRSKNPGLFTDDLYRRKIGELLGMLEEEIKAEGEAADAQRSRVFDGLVGGGLIPGV